MDRDNRWLSPDRRRSIFPIFNFFAPVIIFPPLILKFFWSQMQRIPASSRTIWMKPTWISNGRAQSQGTRTLFTSIPTMSCCPYNMPSIRILRQ